MEKDPTPIQAPIRRLVVVLGDQLDRHSPLTDAFDAHRDALWLAEVAEEATHVPSHKARTALFLSAMRHFRRDQERAGRRVIYRRLGEHGHSGLAAALDEDLHALAPAEIHLLEPGEWRVRRALVEVLEASGRAFTIATDPHFYWDAARFSRWAGRRKSLRMEYMYRELRREQAVLMDGDTPIGGRWNFDQDNRAPLPRSGPDPRPSGFSCPPDAITREAIADVERHFPDAPGSTAQFDWPVTPDEAQAALDRFIDERLPYYGRFQDAMWTGEPFLYHARLSTSLNLKLLDPRTAVAAAERAYLSGHAPLAAVEGFIRQILGWREFIRGIYWRHMPDYAASNALAADAPLPEVYWTGDTAMVCMAETIGQTLSYGYAHHIQRLMVTGLFALLYGVRPSEIHSWYLAVYVDAVEWVELPNVVGMSQYADGGVLASKPYVASGKYIQKMSNYCRGCRFDPATAIGPRACPFTTLFWDFLIRHEARFASHPRTALMWRNLKRMDDARRRAIQARAATLRSEALP